MVSQPSIKFVEFDVVDHLYFVYNFIMDENIRPVPLRELIYQQLLDRVVKGQIAPGDPIRDTEVSAELGVSRTPVREALLRLSKEGLLINRHHRGFVVSSMSSNVIRESYPIIWTLESLALQSVSTFTPDRIARLEKLNSDLKNRTHDPAHRIRVDDQWHQELVSDCPNQRLQVLIRELKAVVLRYEFAYMGDTHLVERSYEEHAEVIAALSAGGVDQALPLLVTHWKRSLDGMLQRLEQAQQLVETGQGEI